MKILSIIQLFLFLSVSVYAQEGSKVAQTIKGKVVDAVSNRPVSYTNIGLENTFYGTASDGEGNFELKIPGDMVEKNIYFSAVGFTNKQFPVNTLFGKEFNVVKMDAQSYGVDEVDVAAQNMVLIRILRMASEDIKYNYGAGPFNLHCIYTNNCVVENKTQTPQKASVLIYDAKGYADVSKEDAYISRKYSVTKEADDGDYRFSTGLMNIDDLLELDWVRSGSSVLNPALLTDFKLSLESQPTIDGKEYWVIAFSQNKPTLEGSGDYYANTFKGKITINKVDYSVLKIEGEVQSSKNNRQGKGLAVGNTTKNYFTDVAYHFEVAYKELMLNQISLNKTYSYNGKTVNEQLGLKVDRVHSNNLTTLETREYFPGE
ncbi:carboxypeptidase-like regulatory domain-containing protein [Prolixibacteraceae bacterium Z1-6]|uniref:Carboxypeptidase-like regulatory domain-containing protein n=1 Tax=Draconibacterium aestuarii TaxID=2998507 RepID=A0A9X3J9F3_9BACT|nr:carboxypeptidase-like regulatory domain-containing protein [Prolixibacteraceae bacterium Z1-6]